VECTHPGLKTKRGKAFKLKFNAMKLTSTHFAPNQLKAWGPAIKPIPMLPANFYASTIEAGTG